MAVVAEIPMARVAAYAILWICLPETAGADKLLRS